MEENQNLPCNYTTLHNCEEGYVVQCAHCNGFQLAFGNVMLNLLPEEFKALLDYVAMKQESFKQTDDMHSKIVHIPTDSRKVGLVFTPTEISQLNDMLQQAHLMQQVYRTLNNHN